MSPNELYYQTGKETILYQSALHREFSDRAFNLLNLSVATLVASGVVINIRLEHLKWTTVLMGLGAAELAGFLTVAVLCLWAMRTQNWNGLPPLHQLEDRVNNLLQDPGATVAPESLTQSALYRTVGTYFKNAAQANQKVLDGKSRIIFCAVVALAIELLTATSLVVWIFSESQ